MSSENYGPKLRKIRQDAGLTQQQLADAISTDRQSIIRAEGRSMPPLELIIKICDYFNYPLWKIFANKDVVLSDLSAKELDIIRWFREFNDEVQDGFIDVNRHILELLKKTLQTMRKKT